MVIGVPFTESTSTTASQFPMFSNSPVVYCLVFSR